MDAKINTLKNGMALNVFSILLNEREGSNFSFDQARLRRRMAEAIQGKLALEKALASQFNIGRRARTEVFKVPPQVLIDNKASNTHTVIEINGRDRPGLLHDVTQALTNESLQISSAHISTFGERVVDVFYVKDVFGLKIVRENKIESVRTRLLNSISGGTVRRSFVAAV